MTKIIYLFLVLSIISCSSSKIITLATQGKVSQQEFNEEISFHYLDKHIFVEVMINAKPYTFLFDTGWDITNIDKSLYTEIEFTSIKKHKTTGSSFEDIKLEYGVLSSLTIGNLDFQDIGVGMQDLSFIKSPFSDKRKIYGIIGTNILRKACWQIDYKSQIIKFAAKIEGFSPPSTAYKIPMIPKNSDGWGSNKIELNINGVTANFIFDTGSYGSFTANPSFLEKSKIPLKEIIIDTQTNNKRIFKIDTMKMGILELKNQELVIEKRVSLLIGNSFLENYTVTIDWSNNQLYLQKLE